MDFGCCVLQFLCLYVELGIFYYIFVFLVFVLFFVVVRWQESKGIKSIHHNTFQPYEAKLIYINYK